MFINNIKKRIVITGLSIMIASCIIHAQGTQSRIGYISSNELIAAMPETEKANAELNTYGKTWQIQYDALNNRYDQLIKKYKEEEKKLNDSLKLNIAAEAQAIYNQMAAVNKQAQDSLQKRKEALFQPIILKANKTIAELAEEKGYDYVVDSMNGMIIYIKKTNNDLLPAAKNKLTGKK